jgi:hypothetical protein
LKIIAYGLSALSFPAAPIRRASCLSADRLPYANAQKAFSLMFLLMLLLVSISLSAAPKIDRIEPPFWWTGMKNRELQIMVHGPQIANSTLQFEYFGVRLKEIVRTENPNYLFVYLDITPEASAGTIKLNFTEGKKTVSRDFELRRREHSIGAQGFTTDDALYLIMPDRFANGNPANDVWDDESINRADPFARHGGDFAGIGQATSGLDIISGQTVDLQNNIIIPAKGTIILSKGIPAFAGMT